jgi:peroxiredoxin Q/BCP
MPGKEGNKAPAFKLPASNGKTVSLADFKGKIVVLYFYPKDNTSGCTTEAKDFRDAMSKLKRKGVVVLGVSKDSIASHQKFIAKHDLNFLLLADEDVKVHGKYGAWGEKNMYGKKVMGTIRSTFIIDGDGRVQKIFAKVRVKGHVDAVIEAIDEVRKQAKNKAS